MLVPVPIQKFSNIIHVSFHTSRFIFNRPEFNIIIAYRIPWSSFLNVSKKSLLLVGLYLVGLYQCTILTSCFSSESTYLTKAKKEKETMPSLCFIYHRQLEKSRTVFLHQPNAKTSNRNPTTL